MLCLCKDKTDNTAGIEDPVYSYVGSCNYESQKIHDTRKWNLKNDP